MKTTSLVLVFAFALFTSFITGCESREREGSCIFCDDTEWIDASGDTFQFGDVVADTGIDPPDSAEADESPGICSPEKVAEVCALYLGVWDCKGVDGYIEGGQGYVVLDILQATDCTMSFSMTNVGQDGFDTVTCDPNHMPPVDSWLMTTYELKPDDKLEIVLTNPSPPPMYGTLLCIRVPQ